MKLLILAIAFVTASAAAAEIQVPKGGAEVTFLAIGNPSALRIRGKTSEAEGQLKTTAQGLSGTFTADLSTLTTGIKMRDEHMTKKYLETDKFPKSTLKIARIGDLKEGSGVQAGTLPFEGELECHGVKKPVTGTVELQAAQAGQVPFDLKFELHLQDFGVATPSFMGIKVADKVEIEVTGKAALPTGATHL